MGDPIIGSLLLGWDTLLGYLTQHVVTCLIPAFFIARCSRIIHQERSDSEILQS